MDNKSLVSNGTLWTSPSTIDGLSMSALPPQNIVITQDRKDVDNQDRAVHVIQLEALRHNFNCVKSTAAKQHCDVIVVVKADGYGHGACATVQGLAMATNFAVATLEEAITLRKVRPYARILVLGPPVGFPECFNEYLHYGIEVMISGPEVATALLQWVANEPERNRTRVLKAATEAKEAALRHSSTNRTATTEETTSTTTPKAETSSEPLPLKIKRPLPHAASTLGNVSGQDLAREVRNLLLNQHTALQQAKQQQQSETNSRADTASRGSDQSTSDTASIVDTDASHHGNTVISKRKLRWHALVDSGMGRLGFKTEGNATVQILKEMTTLPNAPIEFYGMCTHMAEATNADYTVSQIDKFGELLSRVREAGIFVPTISTDNSAALLSPELTHFDANTLLQNGTKGFVRTGGAIYGQRPAFPYLKNVSTLQASVRHVADMKPGDSVGYDRAYVAKDNVRIATLTIGFADGYPRELGNGKGKVWIRGNVFPIAGNVCMDMLMVELDERGSNVMVGDTAILWGEYEGEEAVPLADLAAQLGTTQSALTCGLDTARVQRRYI